MAEYTTLQETPTRYLHIVKEDAPTYDAGPRRSQGWTVMTPRETGFAILAELGPGAFSVYWLLEARADKQGICWPSYDSISEQANISRRHVIRHIETLSAGGWVAVEKRTKANGSPDSNAYKINPEVVTDLVTKVVTPFHQGSDNSTPEEVPTEEERKEEKDHVQSAFEEWYRRYPRHEARKPAERAWRNLTVAKRQAALNALATYKFSPDPHYIPLPASWLNAERWNDEPAPAKKKGGLLF